SVLDDSNMRPIPGNFKTLYSVGLFRSAQARADRSDDPRLVQADRGEQLRLVAVIDVAVGKPQLKERRADRARGERFGDGASRAVALPPCQAAAHASPYLPRLPGRCRADSAPPRVERGRTPW